MHKRHGLALGVLLGGMGLVLFWCAPAHSQKPAPKPAKEENFLQRLAKGAKMEEEDATKFLQALGPALREELRRGKTVEIPGLGTFRVVRLAQHKDMEIGTGRPLNIAATNTVEFLPATDVVTSANSAGAVPAETVLPFQYIPLPGQTPGQKTGQTRMPPTRIK